MTFYNPLFFNYPPFFNKQSTNNAKNVNNYHQNSALKPKSQNNYQASSTQISKLTKNIDSQNIKFSEGETNHIDNKKSNYKNPFNLGIFSNYLQETDNLIILALLYFLYTQKSSDMPLMICLLLLLLDDE